MEKLKNIVGFLDRELRIDEFEDSSNNGLQVENSGRIRRICCGVDASMEFFEAAAERGADLLICHHGLSWKDSLKRITDLNYSRISRLIHDDMALYGCHLPLDAHPKLGNNALICKALGLTRIKPFGMYAGREIGFQGSLPKQMSRAAFEKLAVKAIGGEIRAMPFGKKSVKTVAVVSGGAATEVAEAGQKEIDIFLSGEPNLAAYSLAQEYRTNAIFLGHYATEVFGVRALAELLNRRFSVKAEFIDLGVPY